MHTTLTLLFLLGALGLSAQEAEWKLHNGGERMQVYTRKRGDSRQVEVRIKMKLDASVDQLLAVIDDLKGYPRWVYRCASARKVEVAGSSHVHYQSIVNLPFPFSDRDVVAVIKQTRDPQSGRVLRRVTATPDAIPPADGLERVKQYEATWDIRPAANGGTEVDYRCFSDTGGGLPAWVVNEVVTSGPVKSMERLIHLVEAR